MTDFNKKIEKFNFPTLVDDRGNEAEWEDFFNWKKGGTTKLLLVFSGEVFATYNPTKTEANNDFEFMENWEFDSSSRLELKEIFSDWLRNTLDLMKELNLEIGKKE